MNTVAAGHLPHRPHLTSRAAARRGPADDCGPMSIGGCMRQIEVPTRAFDGPFDYYCPICGIGLAKSNYETFDTSYFCPYCSTQQRPSRVPARGR